MSKKQLQFIKDSIQFIKNQQRVQTPAEKRATDNFNERLKSKYYGPNRLWL